MLSRAQNQLHFSPQPLRPLRSRRAREAALQAAASEVSSELISAAWRDLRRGRVLDARQTAERVLAEDAALEDAWLLMVDSWMAESALARSAESAEQGLARLPRSERLQSRLALCRLHLGEFAKAQAAADQLWSENPNNMEALTALGRVFAALNLHERARQTFERALALKPEDPALMFNLATSLRNFGQVERAERLYDAVILRRPNDWEAFKNRSELRRQTADANHVAELTTAIRNSGPDWRGAVMLLYALGKEREDLGEHAAAFNAYADGARLRRRHMTYSVETDIARMEDIKRTFSAAWISARPSGHGSKEPIFIFGLPRSGSTLLERMLGAHTAILAAGELQNFGVCVRRLVADPTALGADVISKSADLDPHVLGQSYVASTRPRTNQASHFIDKLPGNSLYAGLIAAALPNAVMIHIRRDARDAGFGMFKMLFKQAYPFSYDLTELARYIRAHDALMRHWRDVLPGRIIEVDYEKLVEDPELVLTEVLSRCGLPFEPACLDFHKSGQASSTASAVQVRQPIYKTSLQAWRRFEGQLAPLLEGLARD